MRMRAPRCHSAAHVYRHCEGVGSRARGDGGTHGQIGETRISTNRQQGPVRSGRPVQIPALMNLALFDFDGTITATDSWTPFVRFAVPRWRLAASQALLLPVIAGYRVGAIS